MIISEYVEGTSFNKALEITNMSAVGIDLSTCVFGLYSNGSAAPVVEYQLTATTLAVGDSYVLCNPSANTTLAPFCDATDGSISYSGDDALVLTCGGVVVDSFGQVGVQTIWAEGTALSSQNNTLRRKCGILAGDAVTGDSFDPSVQWTGVGAADAFDNLGTHCLD